MSCQPFVKLDQSDKTYNNAVHPLLCVGNPCQLVQVVPLSGQFGYCGKYRGRNMPWGLPRKYLFPAVGGKIRPGDDRFVLQPSGVTWNLTSAVRFSEVTLGGLPPWLR